MKLSSREAARYFRKPDPDKTGLLIYGADAMRVALKRQEIIAALIGPDGPEPIPQAPLPRSADAEVVGIVEGAGTGRQARSRSTGVAFCLASGDLPQQISRSGGEVPSSKQPVSLTYLSRYPLGMDGAEHETAEGATEGEAKCKKTP